MTEQQKQETLNQLRTVDLFAMIPGYKDLSKDDKEKIITAFQDLIDKEKTKLVDGK
jgi:hypothetical protein